MTCSSSCSTADKIEDKYIDQGPAVTACVVDSAKGGYQCAKFDSKDAFFVSFKDAGAMECVSPEDLESALKTCKKGQLLITSVCTIDAAQVSCVDANLNSFSKTLSEMDNYFCLNRTDRNRLLDRCNPRGY